MTAGFKFKSLGRRSGDSTLVIGQILKVIFWRVLGAVLVVVILLLTEGYMRRLDLLSSLTVNEEGSLAFLSTLGQVLSAHGS
jgi:hypothetical protein